MVLASLPVTELRAALPIGITVYQLPPAVAYVAAVVGNLLPVPIIYWFLTPTLAWLKKRFPPLHHFIERHLLRVKHQHEKEFVKWGSIGLAIFVAAPGLGTGAWTAAGLAVLFGIPLRYAFPAIAVGAMVAGLAMLAITLGVIHL